MWNHPLDTVKLLFLHWTLGNPWKGKFTLSQWMSLQFCIERVDNNCLWYSCVKFLKIWTPSPRNPKGTKPRNPEREAWELAVRMHSVSIWSDLRASLQSGCQEFCSSGNWNTDLDDSGTQDSHMSCTFMQTFEWSKRKFDESGSFFHVLFLYH